MPFVPSASGSIPYLFTPADCTFNIALNADFNLFSTSNTYTPAVTSQAGTITSFTSAGTYLKFGRLCWVNISVTFTNVGSATGFAVFSLPFTEAAANYVTIGREVALTGKIMTGTGNGAGALTVVDSALGSPLVNNYNVVFTFVYLTAS